MKGVEWAGKELYFSFFMGLLLGRHLKESITQLHRDKKLAREALREVEEGIESCRSAIKELKN